MCSQVAGLRKIIDLYRSLTGFTVAQTGESTYKLASEAVSFELTLPVDCSEMEYTPGDGTTELPEYLQGSIVFDASQAPMFLRTVIESIHPVHEEETAKE
jgi:hypothetical protein